jgi:DNA invertase Pin-like site-specific DNA recombinase
MAGDAGESGAAAGEKREKGSGRLEAPVAERRRATTRGEVSRERARARGRGKLTGGSRPSAAPGEGRRGAEKHRDGGLGR